MGTKKNNTAAKSAAKKSEPKPAAPARAKKPETAKGADVGLRASRPAKVAPSATLSKAEHRALTMADYRAMEKTAHAIETMCRLRRKYVAAMQSATECIDRNLDRLRAIVWSE